MDETDNPLAVLYNGILGFVERDLKRMMDVAERISARIGQRAEVVDAKGFEVLSNVIWVEIARSLMDELGSALFAAGRPDEFRKVRSSCCIVNLCEQSLTCEAELRDDAIVHSFPTISRAVRSCHSSND